MALTYQPPFTQTPQISAAVLTAANTARDGSGSITTVATMGSDGGYVKRVTFIASNATAGAVAAKVALLWYSTDGGTTWRFFREIAMATATNSTTAIGPIVIFSFPDGWVLPASAKVGATITVRASAVDDTTVTCEYSDY
jgi:hypothetical protein